MTIRSLHILSCALATVLLTSCGKEEEVYPSLITEFAEMSTTDKGEADSLRLDNGATYHITNKIEKLTPRAHYRVVCGFISQEKEATLYTLESAYYLRDSTSIARQDPTEVLSAWRAGRFINLQLRPMTEGGYQYWGFCVDSITHHNAHISLHHNQNNDPTSYSNSAYASIPVDSIKGISKGDTITLNIKTFKDRKQWTMIK